jgi:hypothetical protein
MEGHPMRRIFRDEALQGEYDRTGFAIFPMLDSEGVDQVRRIVGELEPADGFAPHTQGQWHPQTYHCTATDESRDYRRHAIESLNAFFSPYVDRQLIDYRLAECLIYNKPPGAGYVVPHQNQTMMRDPELVSFSVWVPLVDTNEENGALNVVPGSHHLGELRAYGGAPPYYADYVEALKQKYFVPLPVRAGQAIAFDDRLLHYSETNRSRSDRMAIQLNAYPQEAEMAFFWAAKAGDELEVFAVPPGGSVDMFVPDLFRERPRGYVPLGRVPNLAAPRTEAEFARRLAVVRHPAS